MAPLQPSASPQYSKNLPRTIQEGKRHPAPPERAASFHGRATAGQLDLQRKMRRPKTQPDLFAGIGGRKNMGSSLSLSPGNIIETRVPAKVLVNVNVQRSIGALQVMASTEWTVEELVAAAIKQYVKEGRRPPLPGTDPSGFGLHYSQFSLECLDPKEKLIRLGSRNFFLCPKATAASSVSDNEAGAMSSSSCSNEAEKASKIGIPWLNFMDFLL